MSEQASVHTAMATARSPLEAAQGDNPQPDFGPQPNIGPNADPSGFDFEGLKAAQNKDKGIQEPAQPAQKLPAQEAPKERKVEPDPNQNPLDWRPKKSDKSKQWDQLKATKEAELQRLQSELEVLKKNSDYTKSPEYQKLKQERDEYYDVVKHLSVEKDPEFRSRFDAKREAVIKQAKFAAGGAADKIANLLNQPPSEFRDAALQEAMKDMSPSTQGKLNGALSVLHQIETEMEVEKASRLATFESRQQQLINKQGEEYHKRQQALDKAFARELQQWQDPENGMPFLIPDPNDPQSAARIERIVNQAKEVFAGKLDESGLSKAALWSAMGPVFAEGWQKREEDYSTLLTAYNRLRGVNPDDGGAPDLGAQPAEKPMSGAPADIYSHADSFDAGLRAARQRDGLAF